MMTLPLSCSPVGLSPDPSSVLALSFTFRSTGDGGGVFENLDTKSVRNTYRQRFDFIIKLNLYIYICVLWLLCTYNNINKKCTGNDITNLPLVFVFLKCCP